MRSLCNLSKSFTHDSNISNSLKQSVDLLKKWILFSLFVNQWPTQDFGTFVDNFQPFTPFGIRKDLYQTIALGFGPKKYNATLNPCQEIQSEMTSRNLKICQTYVYPSPFEIANLLQRGVTNNKWFVHPSFLEGAGTKNLLRTLRFKMWADYKVRTKEFRNLRDVIKKETKIFEELGFENRGDFQVRHSVKLLC